MGYVHISCHTVSAFIPSAHPLWTRTKCVIWPALQDSVHVGSSRSQRMPVPAASDPGENAALDEAFQKLTTLEQGQGLEIFHPIRQAVVQSRADETVRTDLEARLIEILQGDATDLAKDYACRQLVIVGSDASIPVLAELLPNPRLSYMARYALEGIGSPAAIQTLREMLGKTDGRQQVGVVISLGRLADGGAVPELAALLDEEDEELREVAVVALGRIGTVRCGRRTAEILPARPPRG